MDKLAAGHGSLPRRSTCCSSWRLMHGTTHCGLGASAPNPLRDTLAAFGPAYERRLESLRFRAGVRSRRRAVDRRAA
jgi:[NiFe] hydrogenase diaphorase moiety large subunit